MEDLKVEQELWQPPKVRGWDMAIGTVLSAFVAVFIGCLYGAWTILQPYPPPTIGPVSVYILAALGLCLASGRQIGARSALIRRGHRDPGWLMPGLLVTIAIGCVGLWMTSLAATVHTPAASLRPSPAPAAAPGPPLTPDQQRVISGSCASSDYLACVSTDLSEASSRIGDYEVAKLLCLGYRDIPDRQAQVTFTKCHEAFWRSGMKVIVQQNARTECERADADRTHMPAIEQTNPRLRCEPGTVRFLNSPPDSSDD